MYHKRYDIHIPYLWFGQWHTCRLLPLWYPESHLLTQGHRIWHQPKLQALQREKLFNYKHLNPPLQKCTIQTLSFDPAQKKWTNNKLIFKNIEILKTLKKCTPKNTMFFFHNMNQPWKCWFPQKKKHALLLVELQCYQPMEIYNPARYWPKGDLGSSPDEGSGDFCFGLKVI